MYLRLLLFDIVDGGGGGAALYCLWEFSVCHADGNAIVHVDGKSFSITIPIPEQSVCCGNKRKVKYKNNKQEHTS